MDDPDVKTHPSPLPMQGNCWVLCVLSRVGSDRSHQQVVGVLHIASVLTRPEITCCFLFGLSSSFKIDTGQSCNVTSLGGEQVAFSTLWFFANLVFSVVLAQF